MVKVRKGSDILDFLGVGQLVIPSSLTGSMASWLGLMIIPRYSTSVVAKQHFSSLRWRSSSVMYWRMRLEHSQWVSSSGEKMRRSSM